MHEASLSESNCFVTLTYDPAHLPADGSLSHVDFQRFMKRVRRHFRSRVRFYMCGEYGPLNQRPHYHACLFGADFRSDSVHAGRSGSGQVFYSSPTLSKLWPFGRSSVQDLTPETAAYCARYIMKKALGRDARTAYASVDEDGVVNQRKPEYAAMSLKPGIGAEWFARFARDVYPHDFVVQDGQKRRPPRYYDQLAKRDAGIDVDQVQFARELRARDSQADETDARRSVREQVAEARIRNKVRSLE